MTRDWPTRKHEVMDIGFAGIISSRLLHLYGFMLFGFEVFLSEQCGFPDVMWSLI